VLSFLLRTVLWIATAAVVLVGSALYHIQLPLAHHIARRLTTRFVNGEIRGELQIGRIDVLRPDYIVARHAALFDGEGRRIIVADRVELVPDFAELRHKVLRFKLARAYHGTVRLVPNAEGDPSLFTTFDSKTPSKAGGGEPLHALVDRLELFDMTLYGQVIELQGVRAEHVDAIGKLSIARGVEVEIEQAHGQMVRPYDFVGNIESLTGRISTDSVRGTKLDVSGTRGDEEVRASVAYRSPAPGLPQELDLELLSSHLTPDTLRKIGFAFATPLAPPLHGRVQLTGPPEQLALSAHVESDAGNAEVSGTISSKQGVSVHITSDSVEVDKLIDGGPSLRMRGLVNINVAPGEASKPDVHAEIAGLRYQGVIVPPFVLDGVLEDNGLRIVRARATQGGQIALRGRVGFDGHTDLQVDAHFTAMQRDPNLSRFAEDLEGTLTATLHVKTPPKDRPTILDIAGKVEIVDMRYGFVHADRVTLNGTARGDPKLPQLDVSVEGDEFQVLSYPLGQAHFSLRGGPRTYTASGEFEAKGQKTFNFNADIAADEHGFVVQAEPIEFAVGTESWRGALHDLRVLHERSVELGFLRLGSRAQRLEASGIVRVHGEDTLQAQLQNFDVTALRAVLGPERFPLTHGYADSNLELRGDVDRPELSITGALREGRWNRLDNFNALYTVTYKDGHLELDSDVDMGERGALQLSGQGELDATDPDPRHALRGGLYDLTLTGDKVDITMLPALHGRVQHGLLDGKVEAQGGLASATLSGQITAKQLQFFGWTAFDLQSRFNYDHDKLVTRLRATDDDGVLARARVNWNVDWKRLNQDPNAYAKSVIAEDFQIVGQTLMRPLEQLPFSARIGRSWPVRVGSSFKVARTVGVLSGEAQAEAQPARRLEDASCNLKSDPALKTQWQLDDKHLEVSLDGQLDGENIANGNGSIAWDFARVLRGEHPSAPPSIALRGQLGLAHIERVAGLCRHGRGKLNATWDFAALGTDAPKADVSLRGEIVPQAPAANNVGIVPLARCVTEPVQLSGDLHADAKQLSLDVAAHGCKGGPLDLQAKLPLIWSAAHPAPGVDPQRDARFELDMQDAELEPALDYLPGVRGFSGLASGHMTAVARRGKVDARGQAALSGGKLYLITTGQELTDISFGVTGNGNWLKLDGVRARVGKGSFETSGGIGLDGFMPRRLQLGLVLRDLPIQREGSDLAWLTGSAAVIGDVTADRLQTAVKLHSLAVRLPNASSRSPQSLEPHPDVVVTTEPPKRPPEKPYSFEFAIDGRDHLTARRNDFEAALSAELALQYRDPDLHVGGYIEFRRATFDLFGKHFEVNRGSMHFDGGTELNPEVSMVATHEPDVVGGSPVIVNVSGTLAKPEVAFYSDRCPGEGAVVLLVSGRCPSDDDSGLGPTNATQDAVAAGIIGGILTLGAQRQLSGLIPRLAVESSARGTRTRVKAGFETVPPFMRNLVQRVYVQGAISSPDQSAGNSTTSSGTTPDFLLELYFPNNIVGAGRVAPTTRSWGLDVTWEP
jgi:hypothetical protein